MTATLGKQKKTRDTESEESADTARKATPQPRDTDRPQGAVPLSISNHAAAVLTQRNWLAHAFLLAGILVVHGVYHSASGHPLLPFLHKACQDVFLVHVAGVKQPLHCV